MDPASGLAFQPAENAKTRVARSDDWTAHLNFRGLGCQRKLTLAF